MPATPSLIAERIQHVAESSNIQQLDVCYGGAADPIGVQYSAETSSASSETDTQPGKRRYLIASITKPIVAMAALKLAAEGEFSLVDRIGSLLPMFRKAAFRRITVRHLLTHSSGFPDMLPANTELRAAHAPLDDFLQHAADVPLDFSTATDCRYSSVGFLLLGAIVEKTTGLPLPEYLQREFFIPLGMQDTWLGVPENRADELLPTVLPSILPAWQAEPDTGEDAVESGNDWGWNSRYWRTLGAPWGGMISSACDLGRYAAMMLSEGCSDAGERILPNAVVQAAMANQTEELASQADFAGAARAWGLGWRQNWPGHSASFGDFLSPTAIGHWGATGTTLWIDPASQQFAAILTTTPYEESCSAIQRVSNIVTVL